MHIVLLKDLFSSISYIIFFVICRSAKEYAHGKVNEENAEANVLMFEPEQCLEIRNYKYSFNRNFIMFWQMELVIFFFFFYFGRTNFNAKVGPEDHFLCRGLWLGVNS